jgi:hypothetical protein
MTRPQEVSAVSRPLVCSLAALAVLAALAFTAAAAQASAAPPPIAAKPAGQSPGSARGGYQGGSAIEAGRNVGGILKAWGSALLLGIAGLMGLAALAKRNVAEGLTLMGLVVIVGGFVFADGAVRGFIESLWNAVSGG